MIFLPALATGLPPGVIETDIREFLFEEIGKNKFTFEITATERGIFSGAQGLSQAAGDLRLEVFGMAGEGYAFDQGEAVLRAAGDARQVARAEEILLGRIGKTSGVATAARRLVIQAGDRVKVVCGAWKKVSREVKDDLRRAIITGGAGIRITEEPFVYLDKNYVRMMGGIVPAVRRAAALGDRVVVVQLRGEYGPVAGEAGAAVSAGAGILMVDTGNIADLAAVVAAGTAEGWRGRVKISFAGGVTSKDLTAPAEAGADVVDVGRAIIDAPLLDFRLDVWPGEAS